jgi:pyruvate dehydrogenase E2 component (dihydrolipoamide acetyltransferase)
MAEVVPMPKLGFDMAEGTLVRKLKQAGENVAKGEIIAEIETDKATVEVEAYVGGVIKAWVVEEGTPVPVGSPMLVIAEPGETVDIEALTGKKAAGAAPAPAAKAATTPAPAAAPVAAAAATTAPAIAATTPTGRVLASPVARKIAGDAGVDLRQIAGSGPNGRIVKRDVEAFLKAGPPAAQPAAAPVAAPAPAPSVPVVSAPEDKVIPLTKLRSIIARRMAESTSTIPAIYLTLEVDMAAALALRQQVNAVLPEERKTSVNDFIIKAAALALRRFPNLNASFAGDKIIQKGRVNIGNAVAVPSGLLTVVVQDADVKPVAQIAAEMKAMAARAREGKVQPGDIEGSTFTVSNLGMYGIEHFTAIINLPEAAILAVGAAREVPVVKDGQLVPGVRMKMTCAADHRVTDGAEVAQFLQAVKGFLEEPLRLLV